MSKKSASKKCHTLPIDDVAELLGVNGRTIRKWIDQKGLPFKHFGRGRAIDWHEALEWYVQYRAEDFGPSGPEAWSKPAERSELPLENMEQALARKTRAEADLKELQLARESGQVAAIADVERVLSTANKTVLTLMLALPVALANRLVGMADRAEIHRILESAVHSTLSNMANIDTVIDRSHGANQEE